MTQQDYYSDEGSQPATVSNPAVRQGEQSQLDFELEFYAAILERHPDYVDVLRIQGNNFTIKGRYAEGLQIDKRLIQLRPEDALVWYNLACSYALLNQKDQSLSALQSAVEFGYRDFRYLKEDRDLDSIRHDPRFRQLLREYEDA